MNNLRGHMQHLLVNMHIIRTYEYNCNFDKEHLNDNEVNEKVDNNDFSHKSVSCQVAEVTCSNCIKLQIHKQLF